MGSSCFSKLTPQNHNQSGWSELPNDILTLISERINSELDMIHFRSVCSNWRSSSVPFNNIFSIHPSFGCLSKVKIFLVKPKQQDHRPWLMPIIQSSYGTTQLFHPIFPCITKLPKTLDFKKFSFLDMGTVFICDYDSTFHLYINTPPIYLAKAVTVTCHGKQPLVLGINDGVCVNSRYHHHYLMLKCGNENWKVIPDMSMNTGDICLFKRRLYAIDDTGWTIMVLPDGSGVQLVAKPFVRGGGYLKRLVESGGDLLLANIYDSSSESERFGLCKLNEKEKRWVKLTSLGDRVLFLGKKWSFSASTSDLRVAKGNCIIFVKIMKPEAEAVYVVDLDQRRFSLISDYPAYSSLFCKPPEWIFKS